MVKLFGEISIKYGAKTSSSFWRVFNPLIQKLEENEIKVIVENFDIALRRSRETVAAGVVEFVKSVNCDVSQLQALANQILQMLQSQRDDEKRQAVDAVEQFSRKTKNTDFIKNMLTTILGYLPRGHANEKIACLEAIKRLTFSSIPTQDFATLATKHVFPALEYAVKSKAGTEQVRREAAESLTAWIIKSNTVSDTIQSICEICLKDVLVIKNTILKLLGDIAINKELALQVCCTHG